jgi:D-aspartate ligase
MMAPPIPQDRPSVLLTNPDYYGTLAAARELGALGVGVIVAHENFSAPASWSRFVTRRVKCPPLASSSAFVQWLLAFGAREPGHVLYPTSDDLAWLFAVHAADLGRYFRLFSPPAEALERLLDKASLYRECAAVGIETPRSWYPDGEGDLAHIASAATFPLLIKQRTQVLSTTHSKGVVVGSAAEFLKRYPEFVKTNPHGDAVAQRRPEACSPMLQEYLPEVLEGTMLVAGFVDRSGQLVAARASTKILQRPRRLGIALCLEETTLDATIVERLSALCRRVGYYGVLHVEFVPVRGRLLLIDFNPRFYHHMAFEAARGLPLATLAYYAACNDEARFSSAGTAAALDGVPTGRAFTHRLDLSVAVLGQRLGRRTTARDAGRWQRWVNEHRAAMVDAVSHREDRFPLLVDIASHLAEWLRHPRSFLRRILRDA